MKFEVVYTNGKSFTASGVTYWADMKDINTITYTSTKLKKGIQIHSTVHINRSEVDYVVAYGGDNGTTVKAISKNAKRTLSVAIV